MNRSPLSPPSGLVVEAEGGTALLTVKVADYYFVGDGRNFDKHYFVVAVSAEKFHYTVDRSYVDFVELDRVLLKKFPASKIDPLPLDEARSIKKILQTQSTASVERKRTSLGSGSSSGSRNSLAYTRESLVGNGATRDPGTLLAEFWIPEESREDIGGKRYQLDKYLQSLLQKPEIVCADELHLFLDEERRGMLASDEPEDSAVTVHDLLLQQQPLNKCVVHRSEEFQYHVPRGHLVVWRFGTLHYDIGFSVEINGKAKVPYTRCNSHRAPVCGILEVTDPSICLLKWDNSYAKLHTKVLSWSVRVVSAEQFQAAKAQALELQRERRRFEQQRFSVHRSAVRLAASLQQTAGMVLLESSVLPDHNQEDIMHVKVVEGELRKYKDEVGTLAEDLRRAESCVEELQAQCAALEEARLQLSDSWQFTSSQLAQAELELQDYRQAVEGLQAEVADRDEELDQLDKDVAVLERALLLAEKARREQYGECTKELRAAEREAVRREKKLRERQQEFSEIRAAIALAASRGGGSGAGSGNGTGSSNGAEQQQRYGEERLVALVEKLLGDVERCCGELERKDAVLRGIGEHIAATAQAAATQSQSQEGQDALLPPSDSATLPPAQTAVAGTKGDAASVSTKT